MAYSEEELIEELKRVSEEHCDGETPAMNDMDEHGKYSANTYIYRFGSWNGAVEEVGFERNRKSDGGIYYTEEELIDEMHRVSEGECGGKSPSRRDMKKYGEYSFRPYVRCFGSWNEAKEEANLKRYKEKVKMSKEELLEEMKRVSEKHYDGEMIRAEDMRKYGKHSIRTYQDNFGSWNEAKEEGGFKIVKQDEWTLQGQNHPSYEHTDSELLDTLRELNQKHDFVTQSVLMRETELSNGIYQSRFGGWNKALEKAGIGGNDPRINNPSGEEHPHWKGGVSFDGYGESWNQRRKECLKRDEGVCRICEGRNANDYFENADVHHITPRRYWNVEQENEEMNALDNLICLCRSCHIELEGKFKGRTHEEFEERAKDYLDMDGDDMVDSETKDSIFAY